jgi:hypothetical protein
MNLFGSDRRKDGSKSMLMRLFVAEPGDAGAGIVGRRDSAGEVKFTVWRALFRCASAVEAEALGPRLDHFKVLNFYTLSPSRQFWDTCMEQ